MAKAAFCFLFLVLISRCAYSARFLDDVEAQPQVIADIPDKESNLATPPVATTSTLPSGQIPTVVPLDETPPPVDDATPPNVDVPPPIDDVAIPITNGSPLTNPTTVATTATITTPSPNGSPMGTTSGVPTVVSPVGPPKDPTFSFFMHDIIGGSHPSARVVSGIIANTETNGIPFSKTNNNFYPISGGSPLLNANNINNLINPNTAPLLTGLNGAQTNTIVQNAGNNNIFNSNNQPFVTAGQLPPGPTLQRLMFGSITVFDDELTEGHELGSAIIGRAQGFYLASSIEGTSQTIALTVLLHSDHDHHDSSEDTISFFGVHRTASHESQIAVVGGTGKYENATGYAILETLHDQEDQHTTDGADTILHFNVYLY